MKPILYYDNISPPARCVLMAINALECEVELKQVDLFKMEQMTQSFLELSPLGRIPVLDTGRIVISDSHAICIYLAETAGKPGELLWPNEPLARARVLEMLFFDCDIAFRRNSELMKPVFLRKINELSEDQVESVRQTYAYLEQYLKKSEFLAGPNVTLADISVISTVSASNLLIPITEDYPHLFAWFERCKRMSWYAANVEGLQRARNYLKTTSFASQIRG